jgi:glyoxylase-like metal-dependent hydrolase (beta-lactamase superfamily II)
LSPEIITIRLPFPLNLTYVNSYLVKTERGFYLIDTGMTNARRQLDAELKRLGCQPGDLNLILLTHGDFDHTGNAAFLRNKYDTKIAMHQGDAGMLEHGDMFWNRKFKGLLLKRLASRFVRFGEKERCTPDILLEDAASLIEYGWDAQVLNTPGHSAGSICFLTGSGDLFCGDLLTSKRGEPKLNSMMYDHESGLNSLERLKSLPIKMVYPGHGEPFKWEALSSSREGNI